MIEQLETIYGTMFVPDTDNGQWGWLKSTGASPEDEQIQLICDLLDERPTGIAIDAGANFGCWSLPLARHATKVLAFEPQRVVRKCLERTVEANADLPITISSCALGSGMGLARFPDIDMNKTTNFGGVTMDDPHPEHPDVPMYAVPVTTIDQIMKMWPDERVSFIKADIEGGELALFKGAVKTIGKWKPIIVCEADHPKTDHNELANFIQSLGYNVEMLKDNNFIGMPV